MLRRSDTAVTLPRAIRLLPEANVCAASTAPKDARDRRRRAGRATASSASAPWRPDQKNTTTEAPNTLLLLRKLPSLTYWKTFRFDQS